MAEPAVAEFSGYGQKESDAARESRRKLPVEVQAALLDIQYDIAADPKGFPSSQLKAINRAQTTFLYDHPSPRVQVTFEIDEDEAIVYFMHYASVTVEVRKKVFVSYAHEDAEALVELRKWLKPLERVNLIELWDDTQIRAGDEWLKSIERELAAARVALLLVSDDFVASDFIMDHELVTILGLVETRGVTPLWLALTHAPFETLGIAKFQALNDPQHPLEEFEGSARKAEFKKIYLKIEEVVKPKSG